MTDGNDLASWIESRTRIVYQDGRPVGSIVISPEGVGSFQDITFFPDYYRDINAPLYFMKEQSSAMPTFAEPIAPVPLTQQTAPSSAEPIATVTRYQGLTPISAGSGLPSDSSITGSPPQTLQRAFPSAGAQETLQQSVEEQKAQEIIRREQQGDPLAFLSSFVQTELTPVDPFGIRTLATGVQDIIQQKSPEQTRQDILNIKKEGVKYEVGMITTPEGTNVSPQQYITQTIPQTVLESPLGQLALSLGLGAGAGAVAEKVAGSNIVQGIEGFQNILQFASEHPTLVKGLTYGGAVGAESIKAGSEYVSGEPIPKIIASTGSDIANLIGFGEGFGEGYKIAQPTIYEEKIPIGYTKISTGAEVPLTYGRTGILPIDNEMIPEFQEVLTKNPAKEITIPEKISYDYSIAKFGAGSEAVKGKAELGTGTYDATTGEFTNIPSRPPVRSFQQFYPDQPLTGTDLGIVKTVKRIRVTKLPTDTEMPEDFQPTFEQHPDIIHTPLEKTFAKIENQAGTATMLEQEPPKIKAKPAFTSGFSQETYALPTEEGTVIYPIITELPKEGLNFDFTLPNIFGQERILSTKTIQATRQKPLTIQPEIQTPSETQDIRQKQIQIQIQPPFQTTILQELTDQVQFQKQPTEQGQKQKPKIAIPELTLPPIEERLPPEFEPPSFPLLPSGQISGSKFKAQLKKQKKGYSPSLLAILFGIVSRNKRFAQQQLTGLETRPIIINQQVQRPTQRRQPMPKPKLIELGKMSDMMPSKEAGFNLKASRKSAGRVPRRFIRKRSQKLNKKDFGFE